MASAQTALVFDLKVRVGCHDRICVNSDADETLAKWESSYVSEVIHHSCRKSDILKKEIRKENENQSENFIYPDASLLKHHALVTLKRQRLWEWCHLSYSLKKIFSVT